MGLVLERGTVGEHKFDLGQSVTLAVQSDIPGSVIAHVRKIVAQGKADGRVPGIGAGIQGVGRPVIRRLSVNDPQDIVPWGHVAIVGRPKGVVGARVRVDILIDEEVSVPELTVPQLDRDGVREIPLMTILALDLKVRSFR